MGKKFVARLLRAPSEGTSRKKRKSQAIDSKRVKKTRPTGFEPVTYGLEILLSGL